MNPHSKLVVVLAALTVGSAAAPARAHALRMTVAVTASALTVKTSYGGGDHESGPATVTVSTPDKRVVASGAIGPDGMWATPKPPAGKYRVVAEDELGHRAEQEVEVAAAPEPKEWKANEPAVPPGVGIAAGVGAIALATLAAYGLRSRKKA